MRTRREREPTETPGTPRLSRTPDDAVDEFLHGRRPSVLGPRDEEDPGLAWEMHRPTDEEQARNGHIRGFQRQGGSLAPTNGHRGSAASWVCVALAVVGFGFGGLALVLGGSVPLLVVGAVLMVAAAVVAGVFDILSDVVLDPPRLEPEEPHGTPLRRIKHPRRA
ncbi:MULTISPECIES: hypothetical protein [unclassified Nocardiopsis]|uniref:hypothetical protein n=1 Tax=unclassified Nocardiopsis TaxID=2649073 RepID=UPI00066E6CA4|nr:MULTISPECIES: hypothetical protein [unclassified Nocardiopsis]MBQ1083894.1 hypothetical protein [Nocardiopsis sp. B62]